MAALATGASGPGPWALGFAASFASKLGDTVSSEVGKAYGRSTFLITTLRAVPRGTEGAVSLEGTAAGFAAAAIFCALAFGVGVVGGRGAAIAAVAATVANLAESFLGATTQGRVEVMTNDVVNVLQICLAAALAIGLDVWMPH